MQNKREKRERGREKKLRLKIRKKFLALTNGKYMWSGNPLLQLPTSLIFHTVCGRTTLSGKDLLGLPATLILLLAFISAPFPGASSATQPLPCSIFSHILLVLHPKFLKLLVHPHSFKYHTYTSPKSAPKTFYNILQIDAYLKSLLELFPEYLKLLWYRMHVYI